MDAVLKCVGTVLDRVENVIVVQQHDTGEERVLDLNSILLYEDRTIIGRISDTFGPVTQPLYTIHFSSIEEATERFRKYAQVLYVPDLAHILMTRPLKTKGTDASNLWDEEVGENEMEFSDDEKEREFKRRRKQADSSRKKMKQSSISPLNPTPRPTPFKRNVQSNPVPPASLYNTFTNGQNLNSLLGMVYPNMNLFPPMQLDFNQLQQLQQMQQAQMQNYSQQQSIQQLSGLLHQLQRQQDNQKPESE
jgi:rRNA processing protein Gar1